MLDGNTSALSRHMADQDRGQKFMNDAELERNRLVFEKLTDMDQTELQDFMSGFNDPEINTCLQRIVEVQRWHISDLKKAALINAANRIAKLLLDHCDHVYGDDLVEERAAQLEKGEA